VIVIVSSILFVTKYNIFTAELIELVTFSSVTLQEL